MKKLVPLIQNCAPKSPTHFSAAILASVFDAPKKTAQRRAQRNRWHVRWNGNRKEYRVPADLHAACLKAWLASDPVTGLTGFRISPAQLAAVQRAYQHLTALFALSTAHKKLGIEAALDHVETCFDVNRISLRQWAKAWNAHGFAGLLDQRPGRSGRRSTQRKASR